MKYIVFMHRNVAEGRAIPGRNESQYVATIVVDSVDLDISVAGHLIFKQDKQVVYVLGPREWYSVRRSDFDGICDVTLADGPTNIEEIPNE